MPLLTFTVKKDELLAKTKLDTFRANAARWKKMFKMPHIEGPRPIMHIWWKNPRHIRRDPEVYKMGIAEWLGLYPILGYKITEGMAKSDGFDSREVMLKALAERNGMTESQVLVHEWADLNFRWRFGPFTKEQSARICWDSLLELQDQAVAPEDRCPHCGLIGVAEEDTSGEKVITFYRCQVCEYTWG